MSLLATNHKLSVIINGQALFNMVQSVLKHMKKALAIDQSAYSSDDVSEHLPEWIFPGWMAY
jgi:hypothetical protein